HVGMPCADDAQRIGAGQDHHQPEQDLGDPVDGIENTAAHRPVPPVTGSYDATRPQQRKAMHKDRARNRAVSAFDPIVLLEMSLKGLPNLERAKGFEPSTPTLARSCSTPEL